MQFPLQIRAKFFSYTPQILVEDAGGATVFFLRQRLLKLKEAVKVFQDSEMSRLCYEINADRVIDFSARYLFSSEGQEPFGSVKREGMPSFFRATYDIYDGEQVVMTIREESVSKRFLETMFGAIPFVGYLVVYLLNPTYLVKNANGQTIYKLIKKPSFLERRFTIERLHEVSDEKERTALLSMLMVCLLERKRG